MQDDYFGSGSDAVPHWQTGIAWTFYTDNSDPTFDSKAYERHAVAVRAGDVVAAVQEPHTYALMPMGVGALMLTLRQPR